MKTNLRSLVMLSALSLLSISAFAQKTAVKMPAKPVAKTIVKSHTAKHKVSVKHHTAKHKASVKHHTAKK